MASCQRSTSQNEAHCGIARNAYVVSLHGLDQLAVKQPFVFAHLILLWKFTNGKKPGVGLKG
jgi:hypothetical protein